MLNRPSTVDELSTIGERHHDAAAQSDEEGERRKAHGSGRGSFPVVRLLWRRGHFRIVRKKGELRSILNGLAIVKVMRRRKSARLR
jgi:hypothetical protein